MEDLTAADIPPCKSLTADDVGPTPFRDLLHAMLEDFVTDFGNMRLMLKGEAERSPALEEVLESTWGSTAPYVTEPGLCMDDSTRFALFFMFSSIFIRNVGQAPVRFYGINGLSEAAVRMAYQDFKRDFEETYPELA